MKRLLPLLLLVLSACSLEQKVLPAPQAGPEEDPLTKPAVVLQNLRQVVAYRETTTAMPMEPLNPSDTAAAVYRSVGGLLSSDGDGDALSAPALIAAGSLSLAFCDRLAERESALPASTRRAFASVNLTGEFVAATARTQLARDLFRMALQREPLPAESLALGDLVAGVVAATDTPSPKARKAAVLACAAVYSSPDALTQ